MPGEPIETELALIRRDIQVINDVLYGNGTIAKGSSIKSRHLLGLPTAADGR